MASTRQTLDALSGNLQESMGVRQSDFRQVLAPAPGKKDIGRRPLRNVGKVAISQVVPDQDQPRIEFQEEALDQLALSIREKGQLCPIRVRWSNELEKWIIIVGERRWRATQRAGLAEIDCYFDEGDMTPSEILEQQLIENCLRQDLRPIEEAEAFASLMQLNSWTGKQVADALRVHPSRVSRALALLKLPEEIQGQVSSGLISSRSAYEISKLPNAETQAALAEKAVRGELSSNQAASAVRQRQGKAKPASRTVSQTFFGENGWKVLVTGPTKGTYFEIEQVLTQALEEVRIRINSGCQLF
jgi:ParB family transcriptional regulator, chromosome partitioning protein